MLLYCLLACTVSNEKSTAIFICSSEHYMPFSPSSCFLRFLSLLLDSNNSIVLCFGIFSWCFLYVAFIEILGGIIVVIKFGKFQPLFLWIFFCPPPFSEVPITHILGWNCHSAHCCFVYFFLISFFSVFHFGTFLLLYLWIC